MTKRIVMAEIVVDDDMAIDSGIGTLDYFEKKTKNLEKSGICVGNTFIADSDDTDDYAAYKSFLFDWLFRDADEYDCPDPPTFLEWKTNLR